MPKELQYIKNLLDQISFVICKTDIDYGILYANKAFVDQFGKNANLKKLIGKSNIAVLEQFSKNLLQDPHSNNIEIRLRSRTKWYSLQVTKLQSNNLLICGYDTTDNILMKNSLIEKTNEMKEIKNSVLKLLEDMAETQKSLRNANKDLRQLDKLKNEFISIASHELRTPMTSIKGFLSMVLDGTAGAVPKTVIEFVKEAYESNEQLISLVNDMLDVSRIEHGKMILDVGKHRVTPLINAVITRVAPIAKEEGNKIVLKSEVTKDTTVVIDPKRFQQVLLNLLVNAIKFSEKSDVRVKVKTIDNFLSISVIDGGIGMSEEEMERLFQKFYQVRSGLARPIGGTGLGLYIAKNLVTQMDGSISVKSTEGKGSTFTFTVPLHTIKKQKPRK